MSAKDPSPQLVAACLLEGCRPVPVDAVVCGRCEGCGFGFKMMYTGKGRCGNWESKRYGHRCEILECCTDWKPRETVGEDERK